MDSEAPKALKWWESCGWLASSSAIMAWNCWKVDMDWMGLGTSLVADTRGHQSFDTEKQSSHKIKTASPGDLVPQEFQVVQDRSWKEA